MENLVYEFLESNKMHSVYLRPGIWKLECQGGYGGVSSVEDGHLSTANISNGGYAKGELTLYETTSMYACVGPTWSKTTGGFGGAGNGGSTYGSHASSYHYAGGSSDIRLKYSSDWDNFESLSSRIIVAGGAGMGTDAGGGGETGKCYYSTNSSDKKASQTSGGINSNAHNYNYSMNGSFGTGGMYKEKAEGSSSQNKYMAPGGGGWYGGAAYNSTASGGGSGYVLTSSSVKPGGYTPTSKFWMINTINTIGEITIFDNVKPPYVKITLLDTVAPKLTTKSPSNLGNISNENELKYDFTLETTTDTQVTVKETLNGKQINSRILTSAFYTTTIDKAQIIPLALNSTNTIVITATDSKGKSVSKTFTFTKVNSVPVINLSSYNSTSATFTVIDTDNNLSKIEWYLDNVLKETITTDLHLEKVINYELTDNAIHTLKIIATDAENATLEKVVSVSKNIMPLEEDASLNDISDKVVEMKDGLKSGKTSIANVLSLKNIEAGLNNTLVELSEKVKESFDSSDASVQDLRNQLVEKNNNITQLNNTINDLRSQLNKSIIHRTEYNYGKFANTNGYPHYYNNSGEYDYYNDKNEVVAGSGFQTWLKTDLPPNCTQFYGYTYFEPYLEYYKAYFFYDSNKKTITLFDFKNGRQYRILVNNKVTINKFPITYYTTSDYSNIFNIIHSVIYYKM